MSLFDGITLEIKPSELTLFSFGGGQDSFCILYKLIYDKQFRQKYAPNELLIVMSDTDNEHPGTYKAVEQAKIICRQNNIEFHLLTADKGYHSENYSTLIDSMTYNDSLFSIAFPQTCTDKLKIKPIDRFLDTWIQNKYGYTKTRKGSVKDFVRDHGIIKLLIGFAKDEEKRVQKKSKFDPIWKQNCVEKVFPLIDLGYDRAMAQQYIASKGHDVPPPSNCMLCFYMSEQELLWLYRNHREMYNTWVQLEANKIEKYKDREGKNVGVFGGVKLIPQKLDEAQEKYGHWSDEKLNEYKMSHGHCSKSKY